MTSLAQIRHAEPTEAAAVAGLIAEAFHPLAVSRWLVPDDDARARIFPSYFQILVDHALTTGIVYLAAGGDGAAVWFPITARTPLAEPDRYEERLRLACGSYTGRFHVLDNLFAAHHPTVSHHYLALIAVRPAAANRGIGGTLLTRHQGTLDRAGLGAYLEAADTRSARLYTRHGYRLQDPGPIHLPDDGPPLRPMWRPPAGPTHT